MNDIHEQAIVAVENGDWAKLDELAEGNLIAWIVRWEWELARDFPSVELVEVPLREVKYADGTAQTHYPELVLVVPSHLVDSVQKKVHELINREPILESKVKVTAKWWE